jgi:hypothetical protein
MTIRVALKNLQKFAPKLVPDYYKDKGDRFSPGTLVDLPDAHLVDKKIILDLRQAALDDHKAGVVGAWGIYGQALKVIRYQSQPVASSEWTGTDFKTEPSTKGNKMDRRKTDVKFVKRQVIANKLLSALDDNGTVAILAGESDLALFIEGVSKLNSPKAKNFLKDLRILQAGAFPKKGTRQ